MSDHEDAKRLGDLAGKRRQAYWKRRRTIDKLARQGSAYAVDQMSLEQLWDSLSATLSSLELFTRDGTSPTLYTLAVDAWALHTAIRERGEQLHLFEP